MPNPESTKTAADLIAELEAERAARKAAEEKAAEAAEAEAQAKKDAAVAKRAKTAAEKKVAALEAGKDAAEKQAADALEAAEAAEDEAAAARRSAERVDEKLGAPEPETDEPFVFATMAPRDPSTGHYRNAHSATYKGRFFRFKAGTTQPVPAGLAESLEGARDKRMKGTAEGAKIFTISDRPNG